MSSNYPKLHLSFFKKEFLNKVIYEDDSLILNVQYILDSNEKIKEMHFCSIGKKDIYYKIKDINPCTDDKNHNTTFYMIHLYSHDDEKIGNHYKFPANTTEHIKDIRLGEGINYAVFRFNIWSKDENIVDKCLFNEIQPETKDGAVVVSI